MSKVLEGLYYPTVERVIQVAREVLEAAPRTI